MTRESRVCLFSYEAGIAGGLLPYWLYVSEETSARTPPMAWIPNFLWLYCNPYHEQRRSNIFDFSNNLGDHHIHPFQICTQLLIPDSEIGNLFLLLKCYQQ